MKGLRIIPGFVVLISLSFFGTLFVEANPQPTTLQFFQYTSPPLKLGLLVLVVFFGGMVIAGLFCAVELLSLYVSNRKLQRKLALTHSASTRSFTALKAVKLEPHVESTEASAPTQNAGSV